MKRDNIRKLEFSDEFLLDSADKRFQSGDYMGALRMLNKRNGMYAPSADAMALAADVYEGLEMYRLAADAWFRFLDVCNEADFAEGYEGLAVSFMHMGNDVQSALYYHRALTDDNAEDFPRELLNALESSAQPRLKLLPDENDPDPDTLMRGLELLKSGDLEEAKQVLSSIGQNSADYPSAAGIAAMCTLMEGKEEEAEQECRQLLQRHPDNIQALTTLCAVLGARGNEEGAKEVAKRLYELSSDSVEDMYRAATALCETGQDEEAYKMLFKLVKKIPHDRTLLYFYAVAAYHTGRTEEATDALDTLCTLYPRAAVARYYLEQIRLNEEGNVSIGYFYRIPKEKYKEAADYFLAMHNADEEKCEQLALIPVFDDYFRFAFDEMDGRDTKMQLLAARVAVKARKDELLREVLLDYTGEDVVKFFILRAVTERNEENSFGVVVLNLYKEFFTHEIEVGNKKKKQFLSAFSDVYSKFAVLTADSEDKLLYAAEDVYRTLSLCEAWEYMDETDALAAVIYREAHVSGGERQLDGICSMFGAKRPVVERILEYLI